MIQEILYSPSALILVIFLFCVMAIQISSDASDIIRHRRIAKVNKKFATKPRNVISVFVEASTYEVFKTIDSLENSDHANIQVIILRKSKSQKMLNQLRAKQRANRFQNFRIITRGKGIRRQDLVEKYALGSLVVFLPSGSVVSPNYLSEATRALRYKKYDSVTPIIIAQGTPSTLGGLITFSRNQFATTVKRLRSNSISRKKLDAHIVYRKTKITKASMFKSNTLTTYRTKIPIRTIPSSLKTKKPRNNLNKKVSRFIFPQVGLVIFLASIVTVWALEGPTQVNILLKGYLFISLFGGLAIFLPAPLRIYEKAVSILITPYSLLFSTKSG